MKDGQHMMLRTANVSEICILTLIAAITLIFFLDLGSYSSETRLVPSVFLAITAVLLAIRVAVIIRKITASDNLSTATKPGTVATVVDAGESAQSVDRDAPPQSARRSTTVIGSVFAYVGLIYLVGLYASIPIFVFAFARVIGRLGWFQALLIAGGTWLASYVVFALVLGLPPLRGIVSIELLD